VSSLLYVLGVALAIALLAALILYAPEEKQR